MKNHIVTQLGKALCGKSFRDNAGNLLPGESFIYLPHYKAVEFKVVKGDTMCEACKKIADTFQ